MGPRQRDTPKYSSHPKEERKESSRTEAGERILEDLRGEATPNEGFEAHTQGPTSRKKHSTCKGPEAWLSRSLPGL